MKRRVLAALLSGILALGMLAGCGKDNGTTEKTQGGGTGGQTSGGATEDAAAGNEDQGAPDADDGEMYHAVLVYVVSADSQDQELVNERFNELTKEQLNMEVTLMPMTFSTWGSQLPLMLAGGEQVDLFPMFSSSAATYVASDYLIDLAPYLEYAPYIRETVGDDTIACCSIGDFIYGIPTMKERTMPNAMVMRTDCLEAAGIDPASIKTYEDITAAYEKVQAVYPDMIMFGGSCNGSSAATLAGQSVGFDGLGQVCGTGVLENYGQTTTVTNYYESDEFRELVEMTRDWYQKGYVAKDMATCSDSGEAQMRAGNLFSYMTNSKPNTKQEKDDQTGYDTTIVPVNTNVMTSGGINAISYGIGSGCPNPEKAMTLLNWIHETKEANDLLNWGVEGVHWVEQEDGTADFPEGMTAESCGYHHNMGYIMPNQFNSHVWAGNDADIFDVYAEVDGNAIVSKAFGFNADLTVVADQVAATTDVLSQYIGQITTGSVEPGPAIEEFNKALYDAGLQDIIDAKQEQLDAWLAEQQ